MVASIQEYGFTVPMLALRNGEVVDGHLRLKAAVVLELAEIPVIVCNGWSKAQVKAFRLLVNRSVSWADWDMDKLGAELLELKAMDFSLALTGFDQKEIDGFTIGAVAGEDEVPEVPVDPVSRTGDCWVMGGHRLLCGDATSAEDVARLLGEAKPLLMVTDPPYGVGVDYGSFADTLANVKTLIPTLRRFFEMFPVSLLTPGIPAMWLYPPPTWLLAWVHPAPVGGCPWGFGGLNPILAYGADPYLAKGMGRRPDCIVLASDRQGVIGHPTPKPAKVWQWLIVRGSTDPGDVLFDPFLGSGTTIIAAEMEGRVCYGLELEPKYVDVAVQRWQSFTGKQATLDGDGRTFEAIKHERFLIRLGAQDAIKEEVLNTPG